MVEGLSEKYPVILLADRGYESYNLFTHIEERLFDYVVRIKDSVSTGILSGIALPEEGEFDITRDLVITRRSTGLAAVNRKKYKHLSKGVRFDFIENSKAPDYEIQIRFVRFKLEGGEYEVLAASLSADEFPADGLKGIYRLRWDIETSCRLSKWGLGMVSFHSKKAENIKQEVYADLIMYNFTMYICADIEVEPGKKRPRQTNYTQAMKICLRFLKKVKLRRHSMLRLRY